MENHEIIFLLNCFRVLIVSQKINLNLSPKLAILVLTSFTVQPQKTKDGLGGSFLFMVCTRRLT